MNRTGDTRLSRRSTLAGSVKVYEQMLLKELPGSKRSNQPMHAVLESSLDEKQANGLGEAQKIRNHALIHYIASLANSNNNEDMFDFDFVESLIRNGADINCTDKNGQTIFHEVARSWNLDVASFLLEHGANLNQQDKFGRSPLHVAAAVDYADMVRFLVKNGADINIKTFGEAQTPIHYSAKNDACKSLMMLLGYGADIDSRDGRNRTPLQVAAEMNRGNSTKLLVQQGAPAGVHDDMGNSALTLLIEKLPDVAVKALDQFHSVSTLNRKEYFFLNYLEGNRLKDPKSPAYSALEIAVHNQEFDIILHPVMQRLISVKWQKFGRQGAIFDLSLNLLYVILWTILAVSSLSDGSSLYLPWSKKAWRLVISIIVCLMTVDEIRRQLTATLRTRNRQKKWITWRAGNLREDLTYCHPRWPQEEIYLQSEIKAIQATPLISTGDSWIYFDWFSLVLILATIASHVAFLVIDSKLSGVIHARTMTLLLLILWFRIMKYARPFEGAGPFVVIFGHIVQDIFNWSLLIVVIAIPYGCAFYITFGGGANNPVPSYNSFSPLLYNMFSMVVVNDHDFEALTEIDATMARLLCGSFIGIMAIINLNLLIALLSDTFTRVYSNAVANAVMQRAKTILVLEKSLNSKKRKEYEGFIKNSGSPEAVELQRDISSTSDRDEQRSSEILRDRVNEIHSLMNERFGKQYGENQKSDFDLIKETLGQLHESRLQCKEDMKKTRQRINHLEDILMKLSDVLNVDIADIERRSSSDDGKFIKPGQGNGHLTSRDDVISSDESSGEDDGASASYKVKHALSEQNSQSLSKGISNDGYEMDEQLEFRLHVGKPPIQRANSVGHGSLGKSRRLSRVESNNITLSVPYAGPFDTSPLGSPRHSPLLIRRGEKRSQSSRVIHAQEQERLHTKTSGSSGKLSREKSLEIPRVRSHGTVPRNSRGRDRDCDSDSPGMEIARDMQGVRRSDRSSQESRSVHQRQKSIKSSENTKRQAQKHSENAFQPRSHNKPKKSGGNASPEANRSQESRGHRVSKILVQENSSTDERDSESEHSSTDASKSDPEESVFVFPKRSHSNRAKVIYSDDDTFRKKKRTSKGRGCYDNWDNTSVKSAAL